MSVIRFTGRLFVALFRIALTVVMAAGFLLLTVPGILLLYVLKRPTLKLPRPATMTLSSASVAEPAF